MKPYVFKEENVRGPRSALRESVKKWRYVVHLYGKRPPKPTTAVEEDAMEWWQDAVNLAVDEDCGLCEFYVMTCKRCPLWHAGHGCLNKDSLFHRVDPSNRNGLKNAKKLLVILEGLYEAGRKP